MDADQGCGEVAAATANDEDAADEPPTSMSRNKRAAGERRKCPAQLDERLRVGPPQKDIGRARQLDHEDGMEVGGRHSQSAATLAGSSGCVPSGKSTADSHAVTPAAARITTAIVAWSILRRGRAPKRSGPARPYHGGAEGRRTVALTCSKSTSPTDVFMDEHASPSRTHAARSRTPILRAAIAALLGNRTCPACDLRTSGPKPMPNVSARPRQSCPCARHWPRPLSR